MLSHVAMSGFRDHVIRPYFQTHRWGKCSFRKTRVSRAVYDGAQFCCKWFISKILRCCNSGKNASRKKVDVFCGVHATINEVHVVTKCSAHMAAKAILLIGYSPWGCLGSFSRAILISEIDRYHNTIANLSNYSKNSAYERVLASVSVILSQWPKEIRKYYVYIIKCRAYIKFKRKNSIRKSKCLVKYENTSSNTAKIFCTLVESPTPNVKSWEMRKKLQKCRRFKNGF